MYVDGKKGLMLTRKIARTWVKRCAGELRRDQREELEAASFGGAGTKRADWGRASQMK